MLSFPQRKIWRAFQKFCHLNFLTFFYDCASLKLRNLKLRKSGSVCSTQHNFASTASSLHGRHGWPAINAYQNQSRTKNSKDRIWKLLVLGKRVHCFPAVWNIKRSNWSWFRVPRPGERTSDRELQYRYLKYMNSIHMNVWHVGSNSTRIHVNSVLSDIMLAIPDDIHVITKRQE